MTTLADLHHAVQAALASKRLGQPVFVRCTLQGTDKAEAVVPRLARLTAMVRDWMGQPLDRVYAVGSVAEGQVALTLQFRTGGTAAVSFAHGQPRGDSVDLMVIGNHGAIYHDGGSANLWDEPLADDQRPEPALVAILERALKSGAVERVEGG